MSSPLANFRDVGGRRVDGGVLRERLIYRADDVAYLDRVGADTLRALGVGLVIDLRSEREALRSGPGPLAALGVRRVHLPLTQASAAPGEQIGVLLVDAPDPKTALGNWYVTVLRDRARQLAVGLREIADVSEAVVFHCAAGKDRTGIFAAVLLSVLGADHETIIDDYVLTQAAMPAVLARLASVISVERLRQIGGEVLLQAPALTMRVMLEEIARIEGGLLGLLREAGLDDDTRFRLNERLVERGALSDPR